jgi:hypothetical protein
MFHYSFHLKTFQENTLKPFGVFLAWHVWIHRKTTPGRAILSALVALSVLRASSVGDPLPLDNALAGV